jgi:transcriptional regulator with XRE-family HTH domain
MNHSQHTALLETVIEAAKAQGISQGELAARVGIRQETLSRAKKNPVISLKTFLEMVRVVGLRVQLIPDHPVAEQITSGTLFPGSDGSL